MIKGIAHLAFQVSNMQESIAFYHRAFGFEQKFSLEDNHHQPWIVYLQVSAFQFIELFYQSREIHHHTLGSYEHLCLETDDIFEFEKHILKQGYSLDKPIILGKDNNYQCWIHDPDQNPIEIMQYTKDSLQLKQKAVNAV